MGRSGTGSGAPFSLHSAAPDPAIQHQPAVSSPCLHQPAGTPNAKGTSSSSSSSSSSSMVVTQKVSTGVACTAAAHAAAGTGAANKSQPCHARQASGSGGSGEGDECSSATCSPSRPGLGQPAVLSPPARQLPSSRPSDSDSSSTASLFQGGAGAGFEQSGGPKVLGMACRVATLRPGGGKRKLIPAFITSKDISGLIQGGAPRNHMLGLSLEQVVELVGNPGAPWADIKALNAAMLHLRRAPQIEQLLKAAVEGGVANTHTWAAAFKALGQVGATPRVLDLLAQALRQGRDVGPVAASVVLHQCCRQGELDLALNCYFRLTSVRTRLNRYAYNCLISACGLAGRVHDGLDLLAHMRERAEEDPECAPDTFTFRALFQAISKSGKWELLPVVYQQMVASKVAPSEQVWCQLVALAARAEQPELAIAYFKASQVDGTAPSLPLWNALLSTLAQQPQLNQVLEAYRQLLALKLHPDAYTYVSLLSAWGRLQAPLALIEDTVAEMRHHGVKVNTHLGTALITAYARCPELGDRDSHFRTIILERADDVCSRLAAKREANDRTFAVLAKLHARAGDAAGLQLVHQQAERAGVALNEQVLRSLTQLCRDNGLQQQAEIYTRLLNSESAKFVSRE
ncbi:hypothetical protein V8C86DRAFT_884349 [Haematococcus lacustris]